MWLVSPKIKGYSSPEDEIQTFAFTTELPSEQQKTQWLSAMLGESLLQLLLSVGLSLIHR